MKALKIGAGALAAIIGSIALVLILGIPSRFVSSAIRQHVERQTGYRLTIAGSTKIGLWPQLTLTMHDITLQDPRDRNGTIRATLESMQANMAMSSAWSGHPEISELTLIKPVLYVPLLRERGRDSTTSRGPANPSGETEKVAIKRTKLVGGTIVFFNHPDGVERRIEGIEAEATSDAEGGIKLSGTARAGSSPLKFDVAATVPAQPAERQTIPVELSLEAPELLHAPLTAKAEARLNGSALTFNGVSGALGDGHFRGFASVDAASKPLVKLDLDFEHLDIAQAKAPVAQASQPWSNAPFDVTGLNYVDAQLRVSAADVGIAQARFAPAAAEATLERGVLKAAMSNLGTYGGQASGEITIDATNSTPSYVINCDLVGVSALPLLTSLADFDRFDGKLQANIAARSKGASQQAILSNLNGTAVADFRDGAIRGLNIAQMIHNLTANTLSGWQEEKEQATDLTRLSASFRIDQGLATTSDLNLVGPLVKVTGGGTVDIPGKSLALRVEPNLVMTLQGQGRASDPVAFGIPVVVEGPWGEPRIYPDIAGILDNPEAAYAKLREIGEGLFGPKGAGGETGRGSDQSGLLGGKLGETLENMIRQGLGGRGRSIAPNPAPQPQAAPAPEGPQRDDGALQDEDSQPISDVLRRLFNR